MRELQEALQVRKARPDQLARPRLVQVPGHICLRWLCPSLGLLEQGHLTRPCLICLQLGSGFSSALHSSDCKQYYILAKANWAGLNSVQAHCFKAQQPVLPEPGAYLAFAAF